MVEEEPVESPLSAAEPTAADADAGGTATEGRPLWTTEKRGCAMIVSFALFQEIDSSAFRYCLLAGIAAAVLFGRFRAEGTAKGSPTRKGETDPSHH